MAGVPCGAGAGGPAPGACPPAPAPHGTPAILAVLADCDQGRALILFVEALARGKGRLLRLRTLHALGGRSRVCATYEHGSESWDAAVLLRMWQDPRRAAPHAPGPGGHANGAAPRAPGPDDDLSPKQARIVAVLRAADAPLRARSIAEKAGLEYDPHFRTEMKQLKRLKKVYEPVGHVSCYWLTSRPLSVRPG